MLVLGTEEEGSSKSGFEEDVAGFFAKSHFGIMIPLARVWDFASATEAIGAGRGGCCGGAGGGGGGVGTTIVGRTGEHFMQVSHFPDALSV